MKILIGADPEVFVKKGRSFVSANGLIPGTKETPHPVDKGAVQVDGMALEFNINPAESKEEFIDNVQSVMSTLESMVPEHKIVIKPSVKFSKKVFDEAPDEAKELGCDPDFNAYTGKQNPNPEAGAGRMRTAAGHIHIGWTEGADVNHPAHKEACEMLAKQLDYYLGLPSLMVDRDFSRRELYGKAGAYRAKPYGMEYRTLSNFWLKSPELMAWVYDMAVKATKDLMSGTCAFNRFDRSAQYLIDNYAEDTQGTVRRKAVLVASESKLNLPLPPKGE